MLKFSLILATVDRTQELAIFLNSLVEQTYQQFELIIADQNNDQRLANIIEEYRKYLNIVHIYTPKGISRSRNAALKIAKGEIVAFPDDDCTYSKGLLKNVAEFFEYNIKFDGLSVRWSNSLQNGLIPMPQIQSGEIKKRDVIGLTCSISIFIKHSIIEKIGYFVENMGLGSGTPYSGAEDYELVFRAIHNGYNIYFKSEWEVFHPLFDSGGLITDYQKNRIVSDGAAKYVLYKNYFGTSLVYKSIAKHFLGIALNLMRLNKEGYIGHFYRLKGILLGKANYTKYFS